MTNVQRDFPHAFNGYDRAQVAMHLAELESSMQRLVADREKAHSQLKAVSGQLDSLRAENSKLQARVEELSKPPENLEDLDVRMQRVGQIAHLKAEEVTTRAQAATEENWKSTAQASIKLRERYRSLLKELDSHAEAMHAEHRAALEETRNEVQQLTIEAVRRRDKLDAEAERKRRAIEAEFDSNMAKERAALEKYIADQRTASKQQAERRLHEATTESRRLVTEATQDANRRTSEANAIIDRLAAIGNDAGKRLRAADKLLADSEKALTPFEEELRPVPRAEDLGFNRENGKAAGGSSNRDQGKGQVKQGQDRGQGQPQGQAQGQGQGQAKATPEPKTAQSPRPHAEATAGSENSR